MWMRRLFRYLRARRLRIRQTKWKTSWMSCWADTLPPSAGPSNSRVQIPCRLLCIVHSKFCSAHSRDALCRIECPVVYFSDTFTKALYKATPSTTLLRHGQHIVLSGVFPTSAPCTMDGQSLIPFANPILHTTPLALYGSLL